MSIRLLVWISLVGSAALASWWIGDSAPALEAARAVRDHLVEGVAHSPVRYAALFVAAYLLVAALALPGAVLLTLLGGALFGFWPGVALVSLAAPCGALLAFWLVRALAGEVLRARLAIRLGPIARGIRSEGGYYLFTLRVAPVMPFFLTNLLVPLTPIRTHSFFWASLFGMLPATLVFVNAGAQLSSLRALEDVLSADIFFSLLLLAVFPILARGPLRAIALRMQWFAQSSSASWRWRALRPRRIERDLIVIGAGSAGLVAAYMAASVRARVTLIERSQMGGECLHSGCVPSKALLRAAHRAQSLRKADAGVSAAAVQVDFRAVMASVRESIAQIAPKDSAERYRSLGVECLQGEARLVSPWTVALSPSDGSAPVQLHARRVIMASGSEPVLPDGPGMDGTSVLTTDSVWSLDHLPSRLLVVGGGPAGCELAQAFSRLGSQVTLVEQAARLLPREAPEVGEGLARAFQKEGLTVRLGARLSELRLQDEGYLARLQGGGLDERIRCDKVLVAMGRRARVDASVTDLGIAVEREGHLHVDDWLRTSEPLVLAAGDVASKDRLTHLAGHMGAVASLNALFGGLWPVRYERHAVPRCVWTEPEFARTGFSEEEALAAGIEVESTRLPFSEIDRALIDRASEGFVAVLTERGTDRIVGASVLGPRAAEMVALFTLAIKERIGMKRLMRLMVAYPSWMDGTRAVAAQWRMTRIPSWSFVWLERWHRWRRR